MVRERDLAGPQVPRAAEQSRRRHGVVRRSGTVARTRPPWSTPATECSWVTSSASGRDIVGGIVAIAGRASSCPRRAHGHVVAPGRGDLERAAGHRPRTSLRSTSCRPSPEGRSSTGGDGVHHPGRTTPRRRASAPRRHRGPRRRSLGGVGARHDDPPRSGSGRRDCRRQDPGVGRSPRSELAGEHPPRDARRADLRRGREDAHRDRQVQARPVLAEAAGREVDHDATQGHSSRRSRRPAGCGRASCTVAPGRPVRVRDGRPRPMYASTITRCPRTPTTVTPLTRPYTVARP